VLTEISLENFKCFSASGPIELSQFNLLTGINGRGKSSVLQSLLLLAQSFDSENSLNYLRLNGVYVSLGTFKDILSRSSSSKSFIISFKTNDAFENDLHCKFSEYPGKNQLADLTGLLVNGRDYFDAPSSASLNEANSYKAKTLGVTSSITGLQQLKNLYFIAADRQGPTNYVEKDDNISGNNIGIKGEHVIHVLSAKGNEFISQVEKAVSFVLSGASVRIPESQNNIIELFIDSINNSDGYMPVNVGFGYSYILPIILTGLLAEENSIIIIENPEAHLHPSAQSRLVKFLVDCSKKKKLQVFLETHSDHVVNGLRISVKNNDMDRKDANIIHFRRDNNSSAKPEISQIKVDLEGNLSDYPDDFMDEWTQQMSQLV
jgi:predicted ATPase